jgi:hypothetical protein
MNDGTNNNNEKCFMVCNGTLWYANLAPFLVEPILKIYCKMPPDDCCERIQIIKLRCVSLIWVNMCFSH